MSATVLLRGFYFLPVHSQMVWKEINLCGFYCVTTRPVVTAAGNTTCLEKGIVKLFHHLSLPLLVIFHSDVSAVETVLGLIQCYLTLLYESIKLMVSDQPLEDAHKAETNWEIIGLVKLPQELSKLPPTGQDRRQELQNKTKHKVKKKELTFPRARVDFLKTFFNLLFVV